jgi:eukaryotic-like serine/threonine-protein kinase
MGAMGHTFVIPSTNRRIASKILATSQRPMSEPGQSPFTSHLSGIVASRFRVTGMLGAGGMGQVYAAEDLTLKRKVALKRMAPKAMLTDQNRERLLREAQRASALNHANIAAVYDVVEHEDELLLVMEYVAGTSLRHRIADGKRVPLAEFFEIAVQCAEGLAAAHAKEILHGDIKPENIMLTPSGTVKILDFGVARRFTLTQDDQETFTLDSLSMSSSGTPAYMSPEVLTHKAYDGRADIFSLGLVFYEMLGGEQPFQTSSIAGTLGRVLHEDPRPLVELDSKLPPKLSNLVQHMLVKDPEARFPSSTILAADLRRVAAGSKPSVSFQAVRSRANRSWIIAAAALALIAAALIVSKPWRSGRLASLGASETAADASQSATRNLVVLPSLDATDDPKLTAFANGLLDSLGAKLTQLEDNHPLQVVGSNEARKKDIVSVEQARKEFAADLGLSVALRRNGDLVSLTYTLTDAKSKRVLRTERLDAPVNDPFSLEDRIFNGVTSALGFQLSASEKLAAAFRGTNNPDAYSYFMQARGYLEDANNPSGSDSAIVLLKEAIKADPSFGKAKADLGSAYWAKYSVIKDETFIPKARAMCSEAIAAGNAGAAGHVCLGVLDNGTGKYDDAAEQFKSAIQLEPANDEAYVGLGAAYERSQNPAEAERTYQRIVKVRPSYWKGYNFLGAFYLRQGDFAKARTMFQKVTELTPEGFRGYANLGATYLGEGRYQDAVQPLERSLALRPTYATYSNLGTAYYHARKYDDAARTYQQAVKLNDKNYLMWGNLAEAQYLAGKRNEARTAYLKAIAMAEEGLKVNPHDPQLLKDLADYYAMLGDRSKAFKYLDDALQYSKFDKETLFAAALIHNQFGETGPAFEWLRKAIQAGYPVASVSQSPSIDNLRTDPRLIEIIGKP